MAMSRPLWLFRHQSSCIYIIDGPSWPQYATVEVGEKSVDLMLPVYLLKGLLDTLRLRARNEFPIDVSFAITNPYTTAT